MGRIEPVGQQVQAAPVQVAGQLHARVEGQARGSGGPAGAPGARPERGATCPPEKY